jgi:hypothetical protein
MAFVRGNKLPRFTGMKHKPESNKKRSDTMKRLHANKSVRGMGFKKTLTEEQAARNRKSSSLKCKYGITLDDYEAMQLLQQNRCAICGYEHSRGLVIDHCHETGKVRGLLCQPCNMLLGAAKDSPSVMGEAVIYLMRNNTMGSHANDTQKARLKTGAVV